MCNPKPSSPNNSSFLPPNYKANFMATPNKSLDNHNLNNKNNLLKPADDQLAQLHRFPTVSEVISCWRMRKKKQIFIDPSLLFVCFFD